MTNETKRVAPNPDFIDQVNKILEQNTIILTMNQMLLKSIVAPAVFVDSSLLTEEISYDKRSTTSL